MARLQHIALSNEIHAAFGTGAFVVPLCGKKRWSPRAEGDPKLPVCSKCADLAVREHVRPYKRLAFTSGPVVSWELILPRPGRSTDLPLAG